jgi:hypothetical protein
MVPFWDQCIVKPVGSLLHRARTRSALPRTSTTSMALGTEKDLPPRPQSTDCVCGKRDPHTVRPSYTDPVAMIEPIAKEHKARGAASERKPAAARVSASIPVPAEAPAPVQAQIRQSHPSRRHRDHSHDPANPRPSPAQQYLPAACRFRETTEDNYSERWHDWAKRIDKTRKTTGVPLEQLDLRRRSRQNRQVDQAVAALRNPASFVARTGNDDVHARLAPPVVPNHVSSHYTKAILLNDEQKYCAKERADWKEARLQEIRDRERGPGPGTSRTRVHHSQDQVKPSRSSQQDTRAGEQSSRGARKPEPVGTYIGGKWWSSEPPREKTPPPRATRRHEHRTLHRLPPQDQDDPFSERILDRARVTEHYSHAEQCGTRPTRKERAPPAQTTRRREERTPYPQPPHDDPFSERILDRARMTEHYSHAEKRVDHSRRKERAPPPRERGPPPQATRHQEHRAPHPQHSPDDPFNERILDRARITEHYSQAEKWTDPLPKREVPARIGPQVVGRGPMPAGLERFVDIQRLSPDDWDRWRRATRRALRDPNISPSANPPDRFAQPRAVNNDEFECEVEQDRARARILAAEIAKLEARAAARADRIRG